MDQGGHDNGDTPKQAAPDGLLAEQALTKDAAPAEPAAATPAPSFPTVDPNYTEPPTLESLRARAAAFTAAEPGTLDDVQVLFSAMLDRIAVIEDALLPFATHALMLANMHMVLTAEGRSTEPSGGTWLNGLNNAQMQSNERIFYLAADAIGRAYAEKRIMDIFAKIQEVNVAEAERQKHVADATLAGPIGGPITGQIH